ncbi:GNAT family N-acetyltransferase [Streptomyces antimycoticus]|uniref:GNAT family N-acetyltransferase n=1 Tax=Streptomyces antimycoticus TaxID=68175 RepID=UPI0037D3433D
MLTSTGEAIGGSGLTWWETFGETEIGWTFARAHWGKGYATEAARAVLAWGFGTLGIGQTTAVIHHGNTASTAMARRRGFTPPRADSVLGRPCTVYALSSDDFAAGEDRTLQ